MGGGASVQSLTAEQIGEHVSTLGNAYIPYKTLFVENGLCGELLHDIQNESELIEMLTGIGITNFVHRKALIKQFATIGILKPAVNDIDLSASIIKTTMCSPLVSPSASSRNDVDVSEILTKSPRQLMTEVFKIQGVRLDPQDINDACRKLKNAIQQRLQAQGSTKGSFAYDCFISYRVFADADIAEKLYLYMKSEGIKAFLDKHCLNDGDDWKTGFITGLQTSKCFVSLISSKALSPCRDQSISHEKDNYLIEIENALKVREITENPQFIIPLHICEYVTMEGVGSVMKKFSDFDGNLYAPSVKAIVSAFGSNNSNTGQVKANALRTPDHIQSTATTTATTTAAKQLVTGSLTHAVASSINNSTAATTATSHPKTTTATTHSNTATHKVGTTNASSTAVVSPRPSVHAQTTQSNAATTGTTSAHGTGKLETITYKDGTTYLGELKDGKRHGQGKFTMTDGGYKVGMWISGKLHGKGESVWADGSTYQGDFYEGLMQGHGAYKNVAGDVYSGDWLKNNKHGEGMMKFANGTVYKGSWSENMRSGKGFLLYASGAKYDGDFCRDLQHGVGRYTYVDGNIYTGGWKDNKKHGQGSIRFANGTVENGVWNEDQKVN